MFKRESKQDKDWNYLSRSCWWITAHALTACWEFSLNLCHTDQDLEILACLLSFCSMLEESTAYVCRWGQGLVVWWRSFCTLSLKPLFAAGTRRSSSLGNETAGTAEGGKTQTGTGNWVWVETIFVESVWSFTNLQVILYFTLDAGDPLFHRGRWVQSRLWRQMLAVTS